MHPRRPPGTLACCAIRGVGGKDPLHSPIAGLHQTNGILGAIPQNMRSHNDLTPYGAATGRLKDRSASQGASPAADAR